MATSIQVTLAPVRFLAGVQGIDLFLDDEKVKEIAFGDTVELPTSPGVHIVRLRLRGVLERYSKPLAVTVPDDGVARVEAKYSRLWGTIKLKPGA